MLGVQMLQRAHVNLATLQCRNTFGRRSCRSNRSNGLHSRDDRRPANCLLIEEWIRSVWRIDNEADALALNEIDHVGAAFFDLVHALHCKARLFELGGGSSRGDQFEAEVNVQL